MARHKSRIANRTTPNNNAAHAFDFSRRTAAVLLHPTSLPSRHGSGDLGHEAFAFVDFLASSGMKWWQTLPHTPPGREPGYSPYSSPSSFAGSPWLVSLDDLIERGYLDRTDIKPPKHVRDDRVNFPAVETYRMTALRIAYLTVCDRLPKSFHQFTQTHASWLNGWSLFAALRTHFDNKPWNDWPEAIRARKPDAIAHYTEKLADEICFHQFIQWLFYEQWLKLRKYAASKGVGLIGDVPIFVGHDSADVWCDQRLFMLDAKGNPKVVSGCPPDAFNKLGQVWNHAHYDWSKHVRSSFAWWIERFRATFALYDGVRIDHFLGFYRVWAVPFGAKDAVKGHWIKTPGRALFTEMQKALGDCPIIAEDLGTVTKEAMALRDDFGFPGMRVTMFGFDGGWDHLPHRHVPHCVAYTGTHDCDTVNGYALEQLKASRKPGNDSAKRYVANLIASLGITPADLPKQAASALIRHTLLSPANTVIIPIQDILGLGTEARMNLPGTEGNNWHWRLKPNALTPTHAKSLRSLIQASER